MIYKVDMFLEFAIFPVTLDNLFPSIHFQVIFIMKNLKLSNYYFAIDSFLFYVCIYVLA